MNVLGEMTGGGGGLKGATAAVCRTFAGTCGDIFFSRPPVIPGVVTFG